MKRGALAVVVVVLVAAVALIWGWPDTERAAAPVPGEAPGSRAVETSPMPEPAVASTAEEPTPPAPVAPPAAQPSLPPVAGGGQPRAAPPTAPPSAQPAPGTPDTPAIQIEEVHTTIRDYRLEFDGNPVGTNAEITSALAGENPRQTDFLTGRGFRRNGNGELIDRWGTPYFFHQVSGDTMEVRSAGPDRVMWTGDDVAL